MIKKTITYGFLYSCFLLNGCGGGSNTGEDSLATLAPSNPTTSTECQNNISFCFTFSEAAITNYKDNKQAAASYTFDDGLVSSFEIAKIFEEYDLRASFYVAIDRVRNEHWSTWRQLATTGHEIGNHSWNHFNLGDGNLTDQQLDIQINAAQEFITQRIGIKPLVFVFPYNSYNSRSAEIALVNHFATRTPTFNNDPKYKTFPWISSTSLSETNSTLTDTISNSGWFVVAARGVDGDGWEPVTAQFLSQHLEFAKSRASQLWIDTFLSVARYRLCKDLLTPKITVAASNHAVIHFEGEYPASLCTEPLTVSLPIKETLSSSFQAYDSSGQEIPMTHFQNMLLINVRPGEEVHIEL